MISIVWQGDHRYNIYRHGQDIGCVSVSDNPYHNQHCYLSLGLDQYDPADAEELFSLLQNALGKPLQVMLYSTAEMHEFLVSGGFARKRRCFEIEVSFSDLTTQLTSCVELHNIQKGSALYDTCCALLYDYYRTTHEAVSPLTVPQDVFCSDLPETAVCCITNGAPIHYAFIEPDETGYEIAYVGTTAPADFHYFAQSLVSKLFQKTLILSMECDDTDPAAMAFMSLFRIPTSASYDTYIRK